VTQIDAFVATHYHEDHVGGIDDLVDMGVAVGERFDRGDKACCSPRRGTGAPARAGSRPTPRRSRRDGRSGGTGDRTCRGSRARSRRRGSRRARAARRPAGAPVALVSLAEARAEAIRIKTIAWKGGDSRAERRRARKPVPTFKEAAKEVHAAHAATFRNQTAGRTR
jgi:hypothetical protein